MEKRIAVNDEIINPFLIAYEIVRYKYAVKDVLSLLVKYAEK